MTKEYNSETLYREFLEMVEYNIKSMILTINYQLILQYLIVFDEHHLME